MSTFKKQFCFEDRKKESILIKSKYPERYPLIIEKNKRSEIGELEKKKYLVRNDLTIGQLVFMIRKYIKIESHTAIFLFINGSLPPTAATIGQVFKENVDLDGFLYILYSGESTFGQ